MLTREEAKTKDCPYFYNHETKTYRKCVAEECPKWRDSKNYRMHCNNSVCTDEKQFLLPEKFICYIRQTCGVRDDFCDLELIKRNLSCCNECSNRYGYCGC